MSLSNGMKTKSGHRVIKTVPPDVNDRTHVSVNPNAGRTLLRNEATGYEYYTVDKIVVNGVTLLFDQT